MGKMIATADPRSIDVQDGHVVIVLRDGQEHALQPGQSAGGWMLRWLDTARDDPRAILESTSAEGGRLLFWSRGDGARSVSKPQPGAYRNPPGSALYNGHALDEVLASHRDLLGDEVKTHGEPSYEAVVGLLPPIRGRRYQILGSPLSRGKYLLWPDGTVTTQHPRRGEVVYSPAAVDARTARCAVYDGLLDDWMPIACYRFEGEDDAFDLLAFVRPEDYAVAPEPLFRLSRYAKPGYEWAEDRHKRVHSWLDDEPPVIDFYADLDAAVRYWWRFEDSLGAVTLPEDRAWRWTKGCLALATTTLAGDHPKYGASWYAREEHDTFPPTVLTMAETALSWGAADLAFGYLQYYLRRVVRSDGSFNYYGPSGSEYGQWLWLLNLLEECCGPQEWIARQMDKVIATGRLLERLRGPVGDTPLRLVCIGAEADNRHEAYFYFSNNLWALRGLRSLVVLADRHDRHGQAGEVGRWADSLEQDLRSAIGRYAQKTDWGPLLPSHIGYPAEEWALSLGPALPAEVPTWEAEAFRAMRHYVPVGYAASERAPRQWIRENTYANYRYHLESLSAMQLGPEYAEALVRLRQERGGELVGMTRFMGWMDDWPVAAYARYLLSTDRVDDFLLLYYGHMAHHGNRETLTYYEQVSADGQAMATDCVPCLLVAPIMTRWMLCFEPVDEESLYLLRGVPRAWLDAGQRISASGLMTRAGSVSLSTSVSADCIEITLDLPAIRPGLQVYVDLRLPRGRQLGQMLAGGEWIAGIQSGWRLRVAPDARGHLTATLAIQPQHDRSSVASSSC